MREEKKFKLQNTRHPITLACVCHRPMRCQLIRFAFGYHRCYACLCLLCIRIWRCGGCCRCCCCCFYLAVVVFVVPFSQLLVFNILFFLSFFMVTLTVRLWVCVCAMKVNFCVGIVRVICPRALPQQSVSDFGHNLKMWSRTRQPMACVLCLVAETTKANTLWLLMNAHIRTEYLAITWLHN